jgi:hypothetical protein
MASKVLPLVMILVGIFPALFAAKGSIEGRTRWRILTFERVRSPFAFWLLIGTYCLMSLALIGCGLGVLLGILRP